MSHWPIDLLDLDSAPFDFLRLEVEPDVDIVLDKRLGTSGGGGFLLIDEYAEELCWLNEFVATFGRMYIWAAV